MPSAPRFMRPPRVTTASALLLSALLAACGGGEEGGGEGHAPQMPPTDVSVATVVGKSISDANEYVGRIQAVDAVELRPRVAGYLAGVHFKEGGTVAKGDLLFTIDDREYRAASEAARADVARAQSRVTWAESELVRSQALIEARAVSRGELDQRRNEQSQAAADLLAAKARLQQAELSLGFTRVTAPIAGRIGAALVKPGNLVAPGETLLSTLVSIDPVHVSFEGDERAWLRYQQSRDGAADADNAVEVGLTGEEGFPHRGTLDFIDNALDPATGTIRARALLPNPDGRLTPGLFARVRLIGNSARDALLIHDQAVLTDQDRKYVWVVGEGNVAQRKDIVPGESIDGLREVRSGLTAGDRVLVNGVRKIFFPGQPIAPREVPMDAPGTPAAPAPDAAASEG